MKLQDRDEKLLHLKEHVVKLAETKTNLHTQISKLKDEIQQLKARFKCEELSKLKEIDDAR